MVSRVCEHNVLASADVKLTNIYQFFVQYQVWQMRFVSLTPFHMENIQLVLNGHGDVLQCMIL